ncbi:MAG: permease [Chloroflexi bacterium]|nr:MAG: permease [Chloroflexota bacterium]
MTTKIRNFANLPDDKLAFAVVGLLATIGIGLYSTLPAIADWITYTLLQLQHETHLAEALNFFIYDTAKIFLLITGMIFIISTLQTFVDTQKVRAAVEKRGEGIGNLMAALLGTITPFCSCSSVPLFIGFVEGGIPLGITFSFLITSPIMNEIAFVLLFGLFGWQVALMYLVSGVSIGVIAGIILGRMKLERYVEDFVYQVKAKPVQGNLHQIENKPTWRERFQEGAEKTREIINKIWLFVIVGIGIGALIHGFVPDELMVNILGKDNWWAVPVSVVLGVPLYSGATGIIPVIEALLDKGAALGTALAFMMSVVALSLPEIIILRRVLKPRLLVIFVTVVATGIIITGYLFNLVM